MLITSIMRAAVADMAHVINKFSVKYLKNPSFTFVSVIYNMKGMMNRFPIIAIYDIKRLMSYSFAKQMYFFK